MGVDGGKIDHWLRFIGWAGGELKVDVCHNVVRVGVC